MQTAFTNEQRADPAIAESEAIIRKCVHCGFCTATCPTYVLLGDELDSPRGRIYLIKDMLENERPATAEIVPHIDRCLSCLACMTTCPSGVDYRRLIDRARDHVEQTHRRPLPDRVLRWMLAVLMPYPRRFALALKLARPARPFRALLPERLRAMLELVPPPRAGQATVAASAGESGASAPKGTSAQAGGIARSVAGAGAVVGGRADGRIDADAESADAGVGRPTAAAGPSPRVAVLTGCVQAVIGDSINGATVRLLRRAGADVVTIGGCCGSIVHHLGRESQSRALAGRLIADIDAAIGEGGLTAVVSNASGCGSELKDLAFRFRDDPALGPAAERVASLTRDVSEILSTLGLPPRQGGRNGPQGLRVAYHSACSMQHAQRLHEPPRRLLREAGFDLVEIGEGHLCCGSAGTYNMLQPALSARLAARKLDRIDATGARIVAAGNLGCLTQLATQGRDRGSEGPRFVHTVELLDWATGGPRPAALEGIPPS